MCKRASKRTYDTQQGGEINLNGAGPVVRVVTGGARRRGAEVADLRHEAAAAAERSHAGCLDAIERHIADKLARTLATAACEDTRSTRCSTNDRLRTRSENQKHAWPHTHGFELLQEVGVARTKAR